MYEILSLTNSTLLTADMILLSIKSLYPMHGSHSPFHRKRCSPVGSVPPPSHLTSYTPSKLNLYLDISFRTVIREPFVTYILWWGVNSMPNTQATGPTLVICLRLLFQYIQSYLSQLEAVPPSVFLEHAMLWRQGTHLIWEHRIYWLNDWLHQKMPWILLGPLHFNRFRFGTWTDTVKDSLPGPYMIPNHLVGIQYASYLARTSPFLLEGIPLNVCEDIWF
jgi:hypothetical protein